MVSPKKILNVVKLCVCFSKKKIKHLIFNKTKNASESFFIYMSSVCVCV